jgi:hypothetical protein
VGAVTVPAVKLVVATLVVLVTGFGGVGPLVPVEPVTPVERGVVVVRPVMRWGIRPL